MASAEELPRLIWTRRSGLLRWLILPQAPASLSSSAAERNLRPSYRPDIDGLRALAILAVVGYHVFPDQVPGGFVGVDVFFVISGFLISTIIFKSLANGNFSFAEFYAHRVRRIFPALIVVMAFCLYAGWNILLANEFIYLGKHIAASAGFVQNFVLWSESGYFDIASELKPLNHLWSLAIEEQFYVIFPLFVWCVWRGGVKLLPAVLLVGVSSFVANMYGIHNDPIGTFFLPQARAWELMAGAVLAQLSLDRVTDRGLQASRWFAARVKRLVFHQALFPVLSSEESQDGLLSSIVSLLGLSVILLSVFGFNKTMAYPGALALLPVLGTTLLIVSGHAAWVNRVILSHPLAVFVGLISYPLYLWHWPLLSYLTIIGSEHPDIYQRVLAALLSFSLAWLTYRFIERPVRQHGKLRKWAATYLVFGILVLMGLGINSRHFFRDYDERTQKIMQEWEFHAYPGARGRDAIYNFPTSGHNAQNKILFFGDSHGDQYQPLVEELLKNAVQEGSRPLPQVMYPPNGSFPPSISQQLLDDKTISTAVLSYYWALMYYSDKVNQRVRCCGKGLMGVHGVTDAIFTAEQMDQLDIQLESTVRSLRKAGKQVYFILDNPFGEELAPRFLLKRNFFHGIKVVVTPLSKEKAIERGEPVRSRVIRIARDTGSTVIDPVEYLCGANVCPALSADGMPMYKDYDHLSLDAVMHHVRYLDFLVGRATE
jgi:peptidoglycan/LPS O-acetylase OafA/YrhL